MEQNNQVTVWTRFGYADIYLDQFERHTSKEEDEDLSTGEIKNDDNSAINENVNQEI